MQTDLTQGSITRHLLGMATFIGFGLIFQTLYYLVDLYFVGSIGPAAIAGVALAGNLFFLAMALAQIVGVGSLSLIARAIGGGQTGDVVAIYRQAVLMSVGLAVIMLVGGYLVARPAMEFVSADAATADAGVAYLYGFLPALALMFLSGAMGSALRAAGVVRAPMIVQTLTVLINIILAPVLIAGWGTGMPLGTLGAGLATTGAAIVGLAGFLLIFERSQTLIKSPLRLVAPDFGLWRRITDIGLPSAGEFALMFLTTGVVYVVIRHFGPEAQAAYGVGSRIMQAIFLPAMAVSFAVAPVAGQNFGAGRGDRVRETLRLALTYSTILMVALVLLCHISPRALILPFTQNADVISIATTFLAIISVNFIPMALIFSASGIFQALGDTRPALIGSATRMITFAAPALWISTQPWVRLEHIWWLSVTSVIVQAVVAMWLLRRVMRAKLDAPPGVAQAEAV